MTKNCLQTCFHGALTVAVLSTQIFADTTSNLEDILNAKDVAAVTEFLSNRSDIEFLSAGNTPVLIRAAAESSLDVVVAILAAGAPINRQDRDGNTALMRAVEFDRPEIVDLLLAANADLSLQNIWRDTAEDIALRNGNPTMARSVASYAYDSDQSSADLFAAAIAGDVDGMQDAHNKRGNLLWLSPQGLTFLETALAARQMQAIGFLFSTSRWKKTGLLHSKDTKTLIEATLAQPIGSEDYQFHKDALKILFTAEVISGEEILAALPNDLNTDAKRLILKDLGLTSSQINEIIAEELRPLPALEYSLPMGRVTDGIKKQHWEAVQKTLKAEGLYAGRIDGIPGTGTYDGVYAYVMGLAPLVVRRAKLAHLNAQQNTQRFGTSQMRSNLSGKTYYLSGERIQARRGWEAIGYHILSRTTSFSKIEGYFFQQISVPVEISSGATLQSVSIRGCKNGYATTISAALLGGQFSISLGGDPEYRHSIGQTNGKSKTLFTKAIVGKLPRVSC